MRKIVFLLLISFLLVTASNAERVSVIETEGTKRVETETVLSYITIHPNEDFTSQDIDASLKKLFATGLFADVRILIDGSKLIIKVIENPIINRISFEGNDKVSDKMLSEQVKDRISPRQVFKRAIVQEVVREIQRIYRAKGRFSATVTPKIIRRPENRVDLVFEIHEGPTTVIRRILFVGNKQFNDETLLEEVSTKEERWWRFWSYDDVYTTERVKADERLLRQFYQKNGYADCKILPTVAELSHDRKDFFVTFTINEGKRYKVRSVKIKSDFKKINLKALMKKIEVKTGEWFNSDDIEKSRSALTDEVGTQGYAFAEIDHDVKLNKEKLVADIIFEIKQGQKAFVERIDIKGNKRTRDHVIRREMTIHEGDPLNTAKMKKSVQNIKDLDYFEEVNIQVEQGSAVDKQNVKIDVEEKGTGGIKFAGGISTSDGWMGMLGFTERNFLGYGQKIDLDFTIARRYKSAVFAFSEPYLMGKNLLGGFRTGVSRRNRSQESAWKAETRFIDLFVGYPITEHVSHRVGYYLSLDDIKYVQTGNFVATAEEIKMRNSRLERERYGRSKCSKVYSTVSYSQLDSYRDPSKGYSVYMSNSVAGIGGSVHFRKNEIGGSHYKPLSDQLVFVAKLKGGFMSGGRIIDRFTLGGDDFLGFETDGVGPREKLTDWAVYGTKYYMGSAIMRLPIGASKELGLRGVVFTNFGSLWASKFPKDEVYDSAKMRVSIGMGIEWFSPIGPIGMSFSRAVKKESYDKTQIFQLTGLFSQ